MGRDLTRRRLWGWIALVAGSLMLLGGVALLYLGLVPRPAADVTSVPCPDIRVGCLLPGQAGRVVFDDIPQAMQPFNVRVEAPRAAAVHVSFAMRGMQMGMNRYRLLPQGEGRWVAQVTLPVCVDGRADWDMTLELEGPSLANRQYRVPFASR